jgi:hypothetical protein
VQEEYGAAMAERLFLFVQFEFPWELGPPDGRYLLRARDTEEPEHVVVLEGLTTMTRSGRRGRGRRGSRRLAAPVAPEPEPASAPLTRATVIDPVSVSAERQAQAWLAELDSGREVLAACAVLNRVLYLHRVACADPYIHELSGNQALVIRAGWGAGEQVASGRWLFAREVPAPGGGSGGRRWPGGRRYSAALRPGERLAQLLSGRTEPLVCEELTMRARLDLDQGRLRHAAIGLRAAYDAALPELRSEERQELQIRIAELETLAADVAAQERTAHEPRREPDPDVVRHALERLEAALRARTAGGLR